MRAAALCAGPATHGRCALCLMMHVHAHGLLRRPCNRGGLHVACACVLQLRRFAVALHVRVAVAAVALFCGRVACGLIDGCSIDACA